MPIMPENKSVCVYLGRFSPFHRGHQTAIDQMVEENGTENCLVMIGSINTRNIRTPYTFEQRKAMIQSLFPQVKVIGLPDGKPGLVYFDGSTNDAWLDSIEKIQDEMGVSFVFYGGSKEDLEILSERFQTRILLDRSKSPELTATNVRKAMEDGNVTELTNFLDPRIVPLAIAGFEEFINLQKNENKS